MCGIAGVLYADQARPVDGAVLKGMARAIAHRGPDAEGFCMAPGVGLAHRRLSIIDLAGGDQPIGNEDGSVQVILNGEIYNFQELRRQLESRGHRFRTQTDTEVLVHLYEDDGEALVERLRGMFAFALWDSRRRKLLLARDRVGLKPLYVYRDGSKLVFGSEIKAILAHPDVIRAVDPAALEDYLSYGVIPGERSIFQNIRKLPPGHTLTVSAESLDAAPRQYWRFAPGAVTQNGSNGEFQSVEEWSEALDAKISETVQLHRIADVPVGAFLSGGLDSSAVVCTLANLGQQNIKTFSIGFEEARFSELPFAREVAARFGCRHSEAVVTADAAASLDDLVRHFDEPFADSSAVPTMLLARLARKSVKVVLSGDGGDEAFGGYSRYAHDLREASLRQRIPAAVRRGLLGPLARLWPKADWLPRMLRAKTMLTNLSLEGGAAYANTLSLCRPPLRRRLLSTEVVRSLDGHRPEAAIEALHAAAPRGDALAGMIAADVGTLLPDDFLTKVDRASMAVGLEVRPPFVDHELLELAGRVPSSLKIHRGETKWILKQMFASRLPKSAVWRAKQGFEIPIDGWLRGPLRETFESSVLSRGARVAEFIDQPAAAQLYRAHRSGTSRQGNLLWSLLVLARWCDEYLGPSVPAVRELEEAVV